MPCVCKYSRSKVKLTYSQYTIDLSIDAMDVSGEHQLDVLHSVFKQRLGLDGVPIEDVAEQYQMGGGEGGEEGREKVGEVIVAQEMKECGRCYYTSIYYIATVLLCYDTVVMELRVKNIHVVQHVMMSEKHIAVKVGLSLTLRSVSSYTI